MAGAMGSAWTRRVAVAAQRVALALLLTLPPALLLAPAPATAKGRSWLEATLPQAADVQTPYGRVRVRAGRVDFHRGIDVGADQVTGRVPPARLVQLVQRGYLRRGVLDRPITWSGLDIPAGSEVSPPAPPEGTAVPSRSITVRFPGRTSFRGLVFDDLQLTFDPDRRTAFFPHLRAPVGDRPPAAILPGVQSLAGRLADATTLTVGADTVKLVPGAEIVIREPSIPGGIPLLEVKTPPAAVRSFAARRFAWNLATGDLYRVGGFGVPVNGGDYTTTSRVQAFDVLLEADVLLHPGGSIRVIAPAHATTVHGWTLGISGLAHPPPLALWPSGAPQCGLTSEDGVLRTFVDVASKQVLEGLNPVVFFDPRGQPRLLANFPGGSFEILPGQGRARRTVRRIDPGDPLNAQHHLDRLSACDRIPDAIVEWLRTH